MQLEALNKNHLQDGSKFHSGQDEQGFSNVGCVRIEKT